MDATEGRQLEQEIESIVLELIKSKRKSLLCKIDFHFGQHSGAAKSRDVPQGGRRL